MTRRTASVMLQNAELRRLRDEIAATSEEIREPVVRLIGTLKGASVMTNRFDFAPDGADPISGKFTDAISEDHVVRVPAGRYVAHLEKVTHIQYSTEQETVTWNLVRLEEIV